MIFLKHSQTLKHENPLPSLKMMAALAKEHSKGKIKEGRVIQKVE